MVQCRVRRPAVPLRPDLGELRPQQKDLSGVIHPEQHDNQAACRTVGRRQSAAAEVGADQELTDLEQERSAERPGADVAPFEIQVRQYLIDRREQ